MPDAKETLLNLEKTFNKAFTSKNNPFYRTFLGPAVFFILVLLFLTGIYLLFIPGVYLASIEKAYGSVQFISQERWVIGELAGVTWTLGGIMRSMHRYGSGLMVLALLVHGFKMLFTDRYEGNRWLNWVSGIAFIVLILITGLVGYLMVWDKRAQFIAMETFEIFDQFPVLSSSLTRALLIEPGFRETTLTLATALHVLIATLLGALLLIHLSRLTYPKVLPHRKDWVALTLFLLAISIIKPVRNAAKVDFSIVPVNVPIDWFYMAIYPISSLGLKILIVPLLAIIAIGFAIIPWLRKTNRDTSSILSTLCTGCRHCFDDCPYKAIDMINREEPKEGAIRQEIAIVDDDKCSSCGTCFGACDYDAIRLREFSEEFLKGKIDDLYKEAQGKNPVLVFACENSSDISSVTNEEHVKNHPDTGVISVPCSGAINPSFVEYALDQGFEGVYISACRMGDCFHRLGNKWLDGRINGDRPPTFKKQEQYGDKVRIVNHSIVEEDVFFNGLKDFKETLRSSDEKETKKVGRSEEKLSIIKIAPPIIGFTVLIALLVIGLSSSPAFSTINQNEAQLGITLNSSTPTGIQVKIDDETVIQGSYGPNLIGGTTQAFEKVTLPSGKHKVDITVNNGQGSGEFKYTKEITLEPKEFRLININGENQAFNQPHLGRRKPYQNPLENWQENESLGRITRP